MCYPRDKLNKTDKRPREKYTSTIFNALSFVTDVSRPVILIIWISVNVQILTIELRQKYKFQL